MINHDALEYKCRLKNFQTAHICCCLFCSKISIKTVSGCKAIADIRVGDSVFVKDEKSRQTGYKTVTAQYANPYQETVYVGISDGLEAQTLIANRIHPFFADGKWIQAGRLKTGLAQLKIFRRP